MIVSFITRGIVDAASAYNLLEQGGCEEGGPATAPEGQELHDLAPGGEDQLDPLYDVIHCDDENQVNTATVTVA